MPPLLQKSLSPDAVEKYGEDSNANHLTRRQLAAVAFLSCPLIAKASFAARPALGPQPGDYFVRQLNAGAYSQPLTYGDLPAGGQPVMAWPVEAVAQHVRSEESWNQVLLLRKRDGSAVAYSAVCQHAGCLVTEWDMSARRLICPCHHSEYDAEMNGAVAAGPAAYPLPHIVLAVKDNRLIASSRFPAVVGAHASRAD